MPGTRSCCSAAPLDLLADLGLAPGLTPLEDIDDLQPALMRRFHATLLGDANLLADYRRLALRHGRSQLGRWFDTSLDKRAEIELADAAGVLEASVPPAADPQALARVREASFVANAQSLAGALGRQEKYKTVAQTASAGLIEALLQADDRAAYARLRAALFTDKGNGTPRKQLGDSDEQAALCATLERIRRRSNSRMRMRTTVACRACRACCSPSTRR